MEDYPDMSHNIKRTALALAVMAVSALGAPSAFAITVTNAVPPGTSTLPTLVADVDVQNAASTVALGETDVNISDTDLIIGRTTGFSVRIDLPSGATFNTLAAPTVGLALKGGVGAPSTPWTVTLAAGGGNTDSYAVYSVQPAAGSTGVVNGNALSWASGTGIVLANVAGLATAGGTVAAKVTFADPNTAQVILTPVTANVLQSSDPLAYSVAPSSTLLKKIDVGSAVIAGKTGFSPNGTLNNASPEYFFEAGTPTVGVKANVLDATGAAFTWAAADTVDLTVTGTFNAFTQTGASVTLQIAPATCAAPNAGTEIQGTVTASQVTFAGVPYISLNAGAGILCFAVPANNAQVIDATSVAVVTRTATGKTNTGSADGLAMKYNGPVAVVYTFNPAGNTTQQSFLRISNTGNVSGPVTITGQDDTGAAAAGSVKLTLAPGQSVQLTSDDLQNGNAAKGLTGALGAGTGKWILTVTGEISGMEVTNLNRNNSSGTVSNLGTPVSGQRIL